MAALNAALDMQFLNCTLFDDGNPGFERGNVNENVFSHFQAIVIIVRGMRSVCHVRCPLQGSVK